MVTEEEDQQRTITRGREREREREREIWRCGQQDTSGKMEQDGDDSTEQN